MFTVYCSVGEKIEVLQKMCKCGTWIDLMVGSAANVDQTSTCCCWLVVRLSSDDRPKSLPENRLKVKVVRLSWQEEKNENQVKIKLDFTKDGR